MPGRPGAMLKWEWCGVMRRSSVGLLLSQHAHHEGWCQGTRRVLVGSDSTRYDAVVIGSGQGGNPLAVALAKAGWKAAMVEREHVGGTCINVGCTPTKTMVASARVAHIARRAADFGVDTGPVGVDMPAVLRRKNEIVASWRKSGEDRLAAAPGLDLLRGEASFSGPHTLEVRM